MQHAVCAVVVTYHPDPEVLENLQILRPQVQQVVVVDNGSPAEALLPLRAAAAALPFTLLENGDNLGIATALNVGIRHAQALGSEWLLLFDQDSQVTPGFTAAMLACWRSRPAAQHLGILAPRYIDKRLGTPMDAILEATGAIETAITSGTLMRVETFTALGFFEDSLFIDGVDHDYSLRLRAAGMSIQECPEAILLHSPGTPTVHQHPMRAKPFMSSNYSPVRRYYQERNKVLLIRRYWKVFPAFCRRQFIVSAKDLAKIVLFESDKLIKLRYFLRGIWDGLRGRGGKLAGH